VSNAVIALFAYISQDPVDHRRCVEFSAEDAADNLSHGGGEFRFVKRLAAEESGPRGVGAFL
jgi:hypothetical protein